MFRGRGETLQFLLVHPGGPFWKNKDAGAWSVPKGEIGEGEEGLQAARREFKEELGLEPEGEFIALSPIKQKSGKVVHVWAFEGDCDPSACNSNTFELEWPPRSGKLVQFPEVDQAAFFTLTEAAAKINLAQLPLLHELAQKLK
jgi:predicted NUDIX family NTP pyrophosphohydrolase